jgi:predicted TIM-barrel fold metal-dependent hydrolase
MDKEGIAVMALSVDQPGELVEKGHRWSDDSFRLVAAYPDRFLPVGNGGNHPAWTRSPDRFLDDNERYIVEHRYPLMGEFEFRHYLSPRQVERQDTWRDVNIPINGPQGHRLFAFAARTGIPFQIHYEIEDVLLPPLVEMLARYPAAKVIWCHLAQVRWASTARSYGADYLRKLLERFPNLYVDTAFGGPQSVYKPSGERHARVWNEPGDDIRDDWKALIRDMPWHFLAALDIGGDRQTPDHLRQWTSNLRRFLAAIPGDAREIVAYKAAWKLLFNEDPGV